MLVMMRPHEHQSVQRGIMPCERYRQLGSSLRSSQERFIKLAYQEDLSASDIGTSDAKQRETRAELNNVGSLSEDRRRHRQMCLTCQSEIAS